MAVNQDAYVTLVMSDNYLPGAAVLAHSLRDAATSKELAVMVTLETLRPETVAELKNLYDYVLPVDRIVNPNPANLYLMSRGDLLYAFTKINVWRLTQFRKVVFVDADVVALRAPDELFDLKDAFAAASDIGWPDAFNSGVMSLTPNMGTYWALHTLAGSGDSFDGADQGLLNQYYEHKDWHRLSFTYNCTPNASYQYEPAYRYQKSKISMVHFIGENKPWFTGRSTKTQSSVYKELVNRWWAVYDRHYRVAGTGSRIVQSFVRGEHIDYGYSSGPTNTTAEPALTDSRDHTEQLIQGDVEPTPTQEQRRFSAPLTDWDATRAPPPTSSKPEAENFPTQSYTMSGDTKLFKQPTSYPEPPRDMWYQVPKEKPAPSYQRPKAIFPWEEREPSRVTRVFADDLKSPEATSSPHPSSKEASSDSPPTPTIRVTHDEVPLAYTPSTKNVWDEVSGIDTYVRQLSQYQKLRGKLQVLHTDNKQTQSPETEFSPTASSGGRRESIILTDFPSAVERPSLPVTPAPRQKAFWGEERDDQGQLPQAEGVPNQVDWNPSQKLEELRRHSLQMDPSALTLPAKNVPKRDMPRSSVVAIPEESADAHHVHFQEGKPLASRQPTAASSAKPSFGDVRFDTTNPTTTKEDVLSPTEHGQRDLA